MTTTKLSSVLERKADDGKTVLYTHPEGRGRSVMLARADDEDLGQPDKITVTIEAGDKLNIDIERPVGRIDPHADHV